MKIRRFSGRRDSPLLAEPRLAELARDITASGPQGPILVNVG